MTGLQHGNPVAGIRHTACGWPARFPAWRHADRRQGCRVVARSENPVPFQVPVELAFGGAHGMEAVAGAPGCRKARNASDDNLCAGGANRLGRVRLHLFRNERNIVARRPETAQVAVERAQHDAPCAVDVPVDDDAAVRNRLRAAQVPVHEAVP